MTSSIQFSLSVMSNSLWPHGLQYTRLPCPSPTPGACSNSCLSNQWYLPTISSSLVPFSCLQSFPASGSFPLSQFFTSGDQSIGVSASASVRLLYWGWLFCILATFGSFSLWRFLTVGGVVWVACQGFLLREACVPVLVGLAGLLSGVQWSVL